jgi:hypothetical protein
MSKRISSVSKDRPDLANDPTIIETAVDIDRYGALEAFGESEAGKILRDALLKDAVGAMDELLAKYKTLTHHDMIAICVEIDQRIEFLKAFSRASTNKELAEEALKELTS